MDSKSCEWKELFPSDELHELVSTLNKSEKRGFTQLSSMGQGNLGQRYMQLFRLLNGDGGDVAGNLPSPDSEGGRQLKSQLRQRIFRALRIQHGTTRSKGKLKAGLSDVELLYTRGLFAQARKRLNQVKRSAVKACHLESQMKCIQFEIQIQFDQERYPSLETLATLQAEEMRLGHAQALERQAQHLYQRVYHLSRSKVRIDSEERLALFASLAKEIERLQNEEGGFWMGILVMTSAGVLALMNREMRQAERQFEDLMQVWFSHQGLIPDAFPLWLTGMRAFLSFLFLDRQFERFKTELRLFQSWPSRYPLYQHLFQFNLLDLELLYHMNTGELSPALPLVNRIQVLLNQDGNRLAQSKCLALSYNVAILFFLHSEFEQASRWCRRIDQMTRIDHRIDLQEFAKLLHLFIWWEREEVDLMGYQCKSVRRYFKKRGKVTAYEHCLLNLANRLAQGVPILEAPVIFEEAYQNLLILAGEQVERKWVGIQEVLLWTQSRAEGRSLKSIFVEKSQEPWSG